MVICSRRAFCAAPVVAFLGSQALLADQAKPGAKPTPAPAPEEPRYENANAITIEGYISEVREVNPPGRLVGIHLRLRTDNDTNLDVYLGPTDYVMEFEAVLEKGSRVEIQGARAKVGTADVILARELHKGGTTLLLRDKSGQPYWNSKGRRIS